MPLPLYICGLAEVGKDGPFHHLDAQLKGLGQDRFFASGATAASKMFELATKGQQHHKTFPMPHLCPSAVEEHIRKCGPICDHPKQCEVNNMEWRPIAMQESQPYADELSDGLAQHLVKFYVEDIARLREDLTATLQSHGDIILKRWKKMSKNKRGGLLARVSEQVFGQWPASICRCTTPGWEKDKAVYWPGGKWLNSGDLANDWMRLVSLLHVRTTHTVESWTLFDTVEGLECFSDSHMPAWFSGLCVDISGQGCPSLCSFDAELIHNNAIVGFPGAFLTMQSQHELLYTLQNVLDDIIGGCNGTGAVTWMATVSGALHPAGRDEAWNPYTSQAFTNPRHFSPVQLAGRAKDRLNMVKDDIVFMQTDPGYMQELIRSKRVSISNISSNVPHTDQLHHAGTLLMMENFDRYLLWQKLSSRCDKLAAAFEHHEAECGPGMHMPDEVSNQILALQGLIVVSGCAASDSFERIMHSTTTFQGRFSAQQVEGQISITEKDTQLDPSLPADRLRKHLKTLDTDPGFLGHAPTFDMILREEEAAKIMDRPTREHIYDLMTLDDFLLLLGRRQRADTCKDTGDKQEASNFCRVYEDPSTQQPSLVFEEHCQRRISVNVRNLLDAPWPTGRKDLDWLAKANKARERLSRLWKSIASEYKKAEEAGGQSSAAGTSFIDGITAFETDPTHQAALEKERKLCGEESRKNQALAEENARKLQDHLIQSEWGSTPTQATSHKPTKTKTTASWPVEEVGLENLGIGNNEDVDAEHTEDGEEPIEVKKDSLAVFHQMYRVDSSGTSGGGVRWGVFKRAMEDAGFPAEEASGAGAKFSNGNGSVSFHKPHPVAVIDDFILYGMGKRLTKWFGFSGERFILREK